LLTDFDGVDNQRRTRRKITRSTNIWNVTSTRAASDFAVMSPKPTGLKTFVEKY
jgi:hypothetical protein